MEEFFIKTKNTLKNFVPFRKINPHVYWNNLLYIFFILITLLILFSFYVFYQIKNQQIFQILPKTTETPSLINDKLLKKVTKSFESKLIKEKRIKDKLDLYKDPSLN